MSKFLKLLSISCLCGATALPVSASVPLLAAKSAQPLDVNLLPSWVLAESQRKQQKRDSTLQADRAQRAPRLNLATPRDELFRGPKHLPTAERKSR